MPDLHELAASVNLGAETPNDSVTLDPDPSEAQAFDDAAQSEDAQTDTADDPGETNDDPDPDADAPEAQSDDIDLSFLDEDNTLETEAEPQLREEDVSDASKPEVRRINQYLTQKEQKLAEWRKELEHMARLDSAFRKINLTPEQYSDLAVMIESAPVDGYAPPATEAEETDPYASDPEIVHLRSQLVEASTSAEEAALGQAIRARTREIQRDLNDSYQEIQRQAQARQQALHTDLTRLEADPRFKAILSDPTQRTNVLQATAHGIPAETVVRAMDHPRLREELDRKVRLAYQKGREKGREEGRSNRAAVREASLPVGHTAQGAQEDRTVAYRGDMLAMANEAEEKGLFKLKRRA